VRGLIKPIAHFEVFIYSIAIVRTWFTFLLLAGASALMVIGQPFPAQRNMHFLSFFPDSWNVSDRIAVIASAVAFLQFVALVWTIAVMVRSSHRELRAYVVNESGSIYNIANPVAIFEGQVFNPTGAEITNPAAGPGAFIQIRNAGQTPANEVAHWGFIGVKEYPLKTLLPAPIFPNPVRHTSVLGPNIPSTKNLFMAKPLTAQEIADLRVGKVAIYVWGEIRYKDAFHKSRSTRYRLMHHVSQGAIGVNTGLTFAEEGNEAE
jgi:hypothetical protein